MKLFAAPECWQFKKAHPAEWEQYACGPGAYGDYLVPDKILGISVKEACAIHDFYYRHYPGYTESDRHAADRIFLNNMLRIISAKSKNRWLARIRRWLAHGYYCAVRRYGAPSYFEERNLEHEYMEV